VAQQPGGDGVSWHNPWWLLLLLLPLPLLFWRRRTTQHPRLEAFIQRHLWARVLSTPLQAGRQQRQLTFLLVWALLSLALAGPYLARENKQQIKAVAANIVVVLDISPSMGAHDVTPSRLKLAKEQLIAFSRHVEQHRLALIPFSANAYTVLPLSHDAGAFRHFVGQMDPSLAYVTGSNVSYALQLAKKALAQDEKQSGGLVLLMSDGEFHDKGAAKAAATLRRAGHKLITIGVGSAQGAPVPLARGQLVREKDGTILTSHLNRATLEQLASAGGGRYFDLRPEAWPEIEAEIGTLQRSIYRSEIRNQTGQPLFPLLIGAALLLLFWQGLGRPAGLAVIVAGLLLGQPDPADAAPWTETKGLNQLKNNDNQSALETYSRLNNYAGQMGKGASAYRLGRWDEALAAFKRAYAETSNPKEQARAAYNQGNALTQLRRLNEAITAFKQAVALESSYSRAERNLMLVNQAKQQWGGQLQADKQQERPGLSTAAEQSKAGAGGAANTAPISGQSAQSAALSKNQGNQNGQHQDRDAALEQSLAQWSKSEDPEGETPLHAWQQYQNLKEDDKTMLQRRFRNEDKHVIGLVEEKPW
jgi:Ca-activated chloride channel family protein